MSLEIITGQVVAKSEYFEVIKAPPDKIIDADIIDDASYKANNLSSRLFQFRYRYVYDDNEKSVWSAISKIPLPTKSTDSAFNALNNVQNVIKLTLFTGDINISKIEIAARLNIENVWSDFFLVDTIDKKRDNVFDNIFHLYLFRNDSVYTPIDIQESNLLFDYVPNEANALELANGNTLVVGGLKDGYDRDTKLDVIVTNKTNNQSPAVLSTLSGEARNTSDTSPFTGIESGSWTNELPLGIIKFSGTPQVGDIITITLNGTNIERWFDTLLTGFKETRRDFNEVFYVTVLPGWGIPNIINAFINNQNNGAGSSWNVDERAAAPSRPIIEPSTFTPIPNCLYFGAETTTSRVDQRRYIYNWASVDIKRSFSFNESDVFPTYKWNGLYKFGIVYYDKHGKTNGVLTDRSMSVTTGEYRTDYQWTPPGSPVIIPENETVQLYINHEPPSWASYYHIVRTKDLSCDFSLMMVSPNTTFSSDGVYMFLDIGSIPSTASRIPETAQVINYGQSSFIKGDRVRILQKYNSGNGSTIWMNQTPLDLPILNVENNSIRLRNIDISQVQNSFKPGAGEATLIEIYRPAKVLSDEDLVYYEIGHKYDIITDENGRRYHDGQEIVTSIDLLSIRIEDIPGDPLWSNATFRSDFNVVFIRFLRESDIPNYLLPTLDRIVNNFKIGDYVRFENTQFNNKVFRITSISLDVAYLLIEFDFSQPVTNETVSHDSPSYFNIVKVTDPNTKYAYVSMFNDGDYYYKTRAMVCNTNGTSIGTFYVADKNFSESFRSAVWSQGRPLVVDEDIKEEYYPAMLRFSQSYIYGTNINNLNRFYPSNFEEADASFGPILRLKTRENFIRLFQRYKVGMIPIYRQIIIDNAASSQVALSERLLNKPNYYSGEYGIDKYGSSLVSTDFGDYFVDTNNKAIVRASLDGITNISDTYNLASWANDNIKEDSFGYGCFNYENRNVIMVVGNIETIQNVNFYNIIRNIVAYSESDKFFESFYGFTDAENLQFVNGIILSGYQGEWYLHDNQTRNNFFGVQQSSAVTIGFNGNLQMKKTYTAIEELSNGLWTGTITTGPLTNQLSSLVAGDFAKTIGAYTINSKENKFNATIKRNQNSAGGKFNGDSMKGLYAQVALTNSLTTQQRLISVSLKYIPSPLTNS